MYDIKSSNVKVVFNQTDYIQNIDNFQVQDLQRKHAI